MATSAKISWLILLLYIITPLMFSAMKTEMLVELYDVARLMRTRFDRWARTYGMTRAQGVILARLHRNPGMTQNEMANICEVEPITVGRLVDRLEARGLLERRLDPADRRIRRLHLLPAAEPILKEIQRYKDDLFKEVTGDLSPDTIDTALPALPHMKTQRTADQPRVRAVAGE